jgi:hypothetical protein
MSEQLASAVDRYIELAESWGNAMNEPDSTTANALYDKIQPVYQEILKSRQETDLFDRADAASDPVAFFIASHMKEQDRERAIKHYERLAQSPFPFVAVSAQVILDLMK